MNLLSEVVRADADSAFIADDEAAIDGNSIHVVARTFVFDMKFNVVDNGIDMVLRLKQRSEKRPFRRAHPGCLEESFFCLQVAAQMVAGSLDQSVDRLRILIAIGRPSRDHVTASAAHSTVIMSMGC
jgi:hypothetical protein